MAEAGHGEVSFATISEIMRTARQRLAPHLWDHAAGGVGTETTLRRNRQVMESIAFRPRLLQGTGAPDITTSVLGHQLDSPIMFAPVGTTSLFSRHGALAPASVAAKRRLVSFSSVMTSPRSVMTMAQMGEVGAAAEGRAVLQFYVRGDRAWLRDLVGNAAEAGFWALCLTADSIGGGTRDRDLLNDYRSFIRALEPDLPSSDAEGLRHQLAFTWDDFSWLRTQTELPIFVKGVTTPQDAGEAAERGAQAIYVSNHGGRALDSLPATIEVLPEIVEAVRGRAEVVVDSGFLRGTDIVKALVLGARAVGIGKLQLWALAAGGQAGLECAVDLLEREVRETLQLLGAASIAQLTQANLRPATPTRYAVANLNEYEWAPVPRL